MDLSLSQAISDGASVLLDTNPLVYILEGSPRAAPFEAVVRDVELGRIQAVITPITLAEVVTGPLRVGQEVLAERYTRALTEGPGFALREIDADIAVLAARVRVQHGLKLPDALQLATALHEGCFALVTHDRGFGKVDGIRVLGL